MTLTTDEAAEVAEVDPSVIRKWVLRGDLEPVRRGARPLRFHYDEVARVQREKRSRAWLDRHAAAVSRWDDGGEGERVAR